VSRIRQFFQVEPPDLLVIVDEVALPLGRLRARARGSAGGHNGLKSIIEQLGTTEFPRLRVGVGRGDARRDLADHVLSKFDPEERDTIQAATLRAADAAEMFISDGIERVMNAFNVATDRKQEDTGAA
jgi:PTH1 family peptidyl-tRNA hydrolase